MRNLAMVYKVLPSKKKNNGSFVLYKFLIKMYYIANINRNKN